MSVADRIAYAQRTTMQHTTAIRKHAQRSIAAARIDMPTDRLDYASNTP
jgi:hypothetical protein